MKQPSLRLPAGLRPLSREKFAYDALKEAIVSGELEPGVVLVQTQIAERLGISPIPVRAAIQRLIVEGLVTQEPHQPPRVSTLTREGLEEILIIRMHLEALATREAVPRLTAEQLAELRRMFNEMGQAIERKDFYRFSTLNKAFHLKIYEACPFRLLEQMICNLWDNSDRYGARTRFGQVPGLAERSHQEHQRILEAIEARQVEAAAALMEAHKTRARVELLESPPRAL